MTTPLVVFLAASAAARPAAPAEAVEPGRRVERAIRAGETLAFSVRVEDGQVVPLAVSQLGIDVTVELSPPGAGPRRRIDVAADVRGGDEPVSLGPEPGSYRIEVTGKGSSGASGRVAVEAGASRPASARELDRLRAEQAL